MGIFDIYDIVSTNYIHAHMAMIITTRLLSRYYDVEILNDCNTAITEISGDVRF